MGTGLRYVKVGWIQFTTLNKGIGKYTLSWQIWDGLMKKKVYFGHLFSSDIYNNINNTAFISAPYI